MACPTTTTPRRRARDARSSSRPTPLPPCAWCTTARTSSARRSATPTPTTLSCSPRGSVRRSTRPTPQAAQGGDEGGRAALVYLPLAPPLGDDDRSRCQPKGRSGSAGPRLGGLHPRPLHARSTEPRLGRRRPAPRCHGAGAQTGHLRPVRGVVSGPRSELALQRPSERPRPYLVGTGEGAGIRTLNLGLKRPLLCR